MFKLFEIRWMCLIILLGSFQYTYSKIIRKEINEGWKFKNAREIEWNTAKVPGTVHTDLLNHDLIPDPFIAQNEREVQWIDKEDWIYETEFSLNDQENENENCVLVFNGLDNYADVILNDTIILNANNMHKSWRVPVKNLIKKNNKLQIYFHSPIKEDIPKYDSLPFHYYAGNDQSERGGVFDKKVSVFSRKAGYQYGWDWGPRLVTSGIWRPVYLETWDGPRIDDVFYVTKELKGKNAEISVEVKISSLVEIPKCQLKIESLNDKKILNKKNIKVLKGDNIYNLDFELKDAKLWWSNGLGEPYIYEIKLSLEHDNNILDENIKKTGIRKIELVRDKDENGTSFYFRLNGNPVFAKGANYIPQDNFLPRVNKENYVKTLSDAKEANMNMIRVWGGGIYENDIFYELCDSLGLMVWQDFMFACSLYPANKEFIENVKKEAEDNIVRLRNHPSLALWCGNNEILEAWQYWGIRKDYIKEGVDSLIWEQYDSLFNHELPAMVETFSPNIAYWPSSPSNGKEESRDGMNGDTHLWNVWAWGEPIDVYQQIPGRFFSEYGFQSFPSKPTIFKFAPDSTTHFLNSNVMMSHQRAGDTANTKLQKYIVENYGSPKDFDSFVELSQLLQADAMKLAIESHRSWKPMCMGSLLWQLNDCWPVVSWATRDYYGNWKAAHYQVKKSFEDILVTAKVETDAINISIVSDINQTIEGPLSVEFFNANSGIEEKKEFWISIQPFETLKKVIPLDSINKKITIEPFGIALTLKTPMEEFSNVILSDWPKKWNFEETKPIIDIIQEKESYMVIIKSDKFIKGLKLSLPFEDYIFEDNYFDLVPGKEYRVKLQTNHSLEDVNRNLSSSSFIDYIQTR